MKTPLLSKLISDKNLDYVNSNIVDGFFSEPTSISSDYKLFHINQYISPEDAIEEMKKEGYRAANAWELLQWPDWNEKDWVVALGSVGEVDGVRYVPYLYRDGSKRYLSLLYWGGGWFDYFRFLGVRNLETKEKELGDLGSLTLESAIKTVKEAGYKIFKEV